ncbi:hypothetical protein IWW34DRAFT_908489 [Fusarium oxysporum f. sp. albedinis]|nr:hypothetical protein IWW34DRAFT_908489 [Fusarium oxysporum f. sp. albedinis]KAK2480411.1 hypothetical protein H9L39_07979 [Fusarium oxysporum f. sp. albedinis]
MTEGLFTSCAPWASVWPSQPSPVTPSILNILAEHHASVYGLQKTSGAEREGIASILSELALPEKRTLCAKKVPKKAEQAFWQHMSTIETGPPLHTLGDRITDLVTEQRFGVVETDEMFESDLTVMLPKAKEAAQQANDEVLRKSYIIRLECRGAS